MNEFEEHFKLKILSVADATFDGVYSRRYRGLSSKSGTGKSFNGFAVPSREIVAYMVGKVVRHGLNLFSVPSKREDKLYMVDMNLGHCECKVGTLIKNIISKCSGTWCMPLV